MSKKTSLGKMFALISASLLCFLLFNKAFAETIKIAIEDYNYPPRYFSSVNGELKGIEIDLMDRLAKKLSLQATFLKCPWNRCLIMMRQGSVDVMPYLLKTADREEYMLYVDPPYQIHSEKCFFVKKGNAKLIQKYEDLYSLNVGVQKGAAYFSPFDSDEAIPKMTVIEEKLLFPMLLRDRFHTFVGACQPLNYIALKSGYLDRVEAADYKFLSPNPAHIAISRKSRLISRASEVEQVIKNLVESDELTRIKKAYFVAD
jgi:polar amino acid transport system substrate-binding protein